MKYNQILARKNVLYAIVSYCHELFLRCKVEKKYWWGDSLDWRCLEAQQIIRLAKTKLGYKPSHNDRDIFWTMQCTWRKMIELDLIEAYSPENISNVDPMLAAMHIREIYSNKTGKYEKVICKKLNPR